MSVSSSGEFDLFYESECRNRIPNILWQFFNIGVIIPNNGLNRIFNKKDFPNNSWPLPSPTADAEIDFWAHTEIAVSKISCHNGTTNSSVPNVLLYSSQSSHPDQVVEKQQVLNMSPEKVGEISQPATGIQYILGEITNGGKKTIFKKIEQLERGCAIVSAKSGEKNILNAVALGLIIANKDLHIQIFQEIQSHESSYPRVCSLYRAGRIIFVYDGNTTTMVLKGVQQRIDGLIENLDSNQEQMSSKVDGLQEQLNSKVDGLQEQLQEQKEQIEGLTRKLDLIVELLKQKT